MHCSLIASEYSHGYCNHSYYRPDPDGTYKCKNVPLPLEENDLVILVVNTRVKHEVGGGEYAKRRDRCYDVAHELGKNSLRDVNTVQELES